VNALSIGPKILGTGALLLLSFLLVGYLLPGSWEADATHVVPSSADAVLPYLDSPEGWTQWTPWAENGVTRSGPERGAGAQLAWDDPELGSGSFTLVAVRPERVEYAVDIGEGAMRSTGFVALTPASDGIRVDWHEEGDLGRNPLMGYWALSMGRAQSEELAKGLARLDSLVSAASGSSPSR
jgi:hypothetical protein